MRMDSFDDDLTALDSALREQIQEMKKLMAELNEWFQQIQERDLRAENEMLRIRLRAVEEKSEYKHMEAEYYKNDFARVSGYYDDLRGHEYKVRNQLPLKKRYRERQYDPSTNTTSLKDDGEEKGDKGDDVAAAKDSRPSESHGSLRDQ
nr:hypothetical protein [Tanacetum cinerariifolium]